MFNVQAAHLVKVDCFGSITPTPPMLVHLGTTSPTTFFRLFLLSPWFQQKSAIFPTKKCSKGPNIIKLSLALKWPRLNELPQTFFIVSFLPRNGLLCQFLISYTHTPPTLPLPLLPLLLAAESESGSTSCCKGNSGLGPRPPPRWLHHWCKLAHQWCRATPNIGARLFY